MTGSFFSQRYPYLHFHQVLRVKSLVISVTPSPQIFPYLTAGYPLRPVKPLPALRFLIPTRPGYFPYTGKKAKMTIRAGSFIPVVFAGLRRDNLIRPHNKPGDAGHVRCLP